MAKKKKKREKEIHLKDSNSKYFFFKKNHLEPIHISFIKKKAIICSPVFLFFCFFLFHYFVETTASMMSEKKLKNQENLIKKRFND